MPIREPPHARALVPALLLALAVLGAGLPGLDDVGVTWDEPRYFRSVERIQDWTADAASARWKAALTPDEIRGAWDVERYWNPHPPFYKTVMAVTEAATGGRLSPPAGYRLSSLLMFALLVGLVTAWTTRLTRPAAGVAAGLSLALMPRVFGHAHVGATDMPLALLWFVATMGVLFYALEDRRRWLLLAALAGGCALATKFTALLLPVPLAGWVLFRPGRWRLLAAGLAAFLIAVVVSVIVNPAAWPDPVAYQVRLITESIARESEIPVSTYYLARTYRFQVPWHHVVVMTAAVLPVGIVGLALVGLKTAVRRGATRPLALLCVIQIVFWWGLLALPGSPNHDGVRLWLPMFPFVAVLAGIGFGILAGALERRLERRAAAAALLGLAGLFFGPPALATAHVAPHYLSYYGELAGGPAGAARHGLEATYWFDAFTRGFREEVERTLPQGARVVAYPNAEYYALLQEMGLLRSDLRFSGEPPADYLLLLGRKAMLYGGWENVYRRSRPLLAAELDGVELIGLYEWTGREAVDTAVGETP